MRVLGAPGALAFSPFAGLPVVRWSSRRSLVFPAGTLVLWSNACAVAQADDWKAGVPTGWPCRRVLSTRPALRSARRVPVVHEYVLLVHGVRGPSAFPEHLETQSWSLSIPSWLGASLVGARFVNEPLGCVDLLRGVGMVPGRDLRLRPSIW